MLKVKKPIILFIEHKAIISELWFMSKRSSSDISSAGGRDMLVVLLLGRNTNLLTRKEIFPRLSVFGFQTFLKAFSLWDIKPVACSLPHFVWSCLSAFLSSLSSAHLDFLIIRISVFCEIYLWTSNKWSENNWYTVSTEHLCLWW